MYLFMALAAVLAVGLDQFTKYLTVLKIEEWGAQKAIPGLFSLTFCKNTGAAWSSFEGQIWLFIVVFLVLTAGIIWEFKTKKLGFTNFERWCILFVWAGGLGNMIDRIRLGYVVDMINLEFMNFPVFNVADCFITCGCAALILHLAFFNKAFWKEEKKK